MNPGVPQKQESLSRDSLAVSQRTILWTSGSTFRVGLILVGLLSTLAFASSTLGAKANLGLGSAARPFVLGGSTITNTSHHA
jgi:hypothetical protein